MEPMAVIRPSPINPIPTLRSRSPNPTSINATPVTMMINMVFVLACMDVSCSHRRAREVSSGGSPHNNHRHAKTRRDARANGAVASDQ
ncbi:hypothetical protein D3C72_1937420 [compost metagenome]